MKLGIQVGLGHGHIVLHGDPAPPSLKGHSPSIFGKCPLWPAEWAMPLGVDVCLGPGDFMFDLEWTQLPPEERAQQPPSFRPMSIVAKVANRS